MTAIPDSERARLEQMLTAQLGADGSFGETLRGDGLSAPEEHVGLPTITIGGNGPGATQPQTGAEFVLERELGAGGMGVVMLARQRSLEREVAIKFSTAQLARDAAALMDEAVLTGGLEHPNVIPVHALGKTPDGRPLLVMKRVAGQSWAESMRSSGTSTSWLMRRDPLAFNLDVLMHACNALHFAHSRGIVHRDLKPENVMLGAFGELYLLDWGIAWRTSTPPERWSSNIVGTLGYMAPEMLQGSGPHITPLTDVYLLGAVLHEILTGSPRHGGKSVAQCIVSISESKPVRFGDGIPTELADLCNRATALDPAQRPPSALAFREAIERFLQHRSSVHLLAESVRRFDTLAKLLDSQKPDTARVWRLFSECRFGLQQALRVWDENKEAHALLQRALASMCAFEVQRRKLGSAEGILAEIDAPAPELAASLQRLRDELQAERERLARLEQLEHQQDSRVSSKQRALATFVSGLAFAGGLWAVAFFEARGYSPTFGHVYTMLGAFSVGAAAIIVAGRASLLQNKFNRDSVAAIGLAGAGAFLAVLCAQLRGFTPHDAVMLTMLCFAMLEAGIGVVVYRPALVAALCSIAGVVVSAAWPGAALYACGVALIAAHAFVAWRWWLHSSERAAVG